MVNGDDDDVEDIVDDSGDDRLADGDTRLMLYSYCATCFSCCVFLVNFEESFNFVISFHLLSQSYVINLFGSVIDSLLLRSSIN